MNVSTQARIPFWITVEPGITARTPAKAYVTSDQPQLLDVNYTINGDRMAFVCPFNDVSISWDADGLVGVSVNVSSNKVYFIANYSAEKMSDGNFRGSCCVEMCGTTACGGSVCNTCGGTTACCGEVVVVKPIVAP